MTMQGPGSNPVPQGSSGRTSNLKSDFPQVCRFAHAGGFDDPDFLRGSDLKFGRIVFDEFSTALTNGQTEHALTAVRVLCGNQKKLHPKLKEFIREFETELGNSCVGCSLRARNQTIFDALVAADFPLDAEITIKHAGYSKPAKGNALHLAASLGNAAAVNSLSSTDINLHTEDSFGLTPIEAAAASLRHSVRDLKSNPASETFQNSIVNLLATASRLFEHKERGWNDSSPQTSFANAYLSLILHFDGVGRKSITEVYSSQCHLEAELERQAGDPARVKQLADFRECIRLFEKATKTTASVHFQPRNIGDTVYAEMIGEGTSVGALAAVWKTMAGIDVLREHDARNMGREISLAPALGDLLFKFSSAPSIRIATNADSDLYNKKQNPWEAELLALWSHPEVKFTREDLFTNLLSKALTAPYDFQNKGMPKLPWDNVGILKDTGILTWAFKKYKADSTSYTDDNGRLTTLLEEYGFIRQADGPTFGSSFFLQRGDGFIEFNRGGLLISKKRLGTYLVRNSSPIFGRDLLESSAFYSKGGSGRSNFAEMFRGFVFDEAAEPQIERIDLGRGFRHIMSIELHRKPSLIQRCRGLIDFGMEELSRYAQWKCNTDHGEICFSERQSGHGQDKLRLRDGAPYSQRFSPGLQHVITMAKSHNREKVPNGHPPLALAWYDRRLPAFSIYDFPGPDGSMRQELELSPAVCTGFRAQFRNSATYAQIVPTGVHSFMQKGIQLGNVAELVIVDRRVRR